MRARHPLSALLVAALLLLTGMESTQPAEAGKKFRTVTKVFASTGQFAIPAAGTSGSADHYPATIEVRGFKRGKIKDINVRLSGLGHQSFDDIDVLLVAANGRNALIMSDVGGASGVFGVNYIFDDEAGEALLDDIPSLIERVRPTNAPTSSDTFPAPAPIPSGNAALSVFDGGNPNGEWKLFIMDDSNQFTGSMTGGWSLEITARVKNKKK